MPEIIAFSSGQWYDSRIHPLRANSGRLAEPFKVVHTPAGIRSNVAGIGADVNVAEADALIDTVVALDRDPRYDELSFGVISLLSSSKQALYLQRQLFDRLGEAAYQRRRLKVGEAYAFQGAERDVMFVSMVVSPHEKIGAFTDVQAHRRVNVTASRARDQLWIFHSAEVHDFVPSDIRRLWLQYATSGSSAPQHVERLEELCDSGFERAVLKRLVGRGYAPIPQFRIGNFRIDFVVALEDGSRIAIECDGDAYHQDLEADAARQEVLERVGRCTFFRVRGSVFGRDPEAALEPLWRLLEGRGAPRWGSSRSSDQPPSPTPPPAPRDGKQADAEGGLPWLLNPDDPEVGMRAKGKPPEHRPMTPIEVPATGLTTGATAMRPLSAIADAPVVDVDEWAVRIPGQPRHTRPDQAAVAKAANRERAQNSPSSVDAPLPAGYRLVGWIRPTEALAALQAVRSQCDAPVVDEQGAHSGTVRYHAADSAEAVQFRAQAQVVRHSATRGDRTAAWLRADEAASILAAVDTGEGFEVAPGGSLVEFFDPTSAVSVKYRSPTRLLRPTRR